MQIPGIGVTTVERILALREATGNITLESLASIPRLRNFAELRNIFDFTPVSFEHASPVPEGQRVASPPIVPYPYEYFPARRQERASSLPTRLLDTSEPYGQRRRSLPLDFVGAEPAMPIAMPQASVDRPLHGVEGTPVQQGVSPSLGGERVGQRDDGHTFTDLGPTGESRLSHREQTVDDGHVGLREPGVEPRLQDNLCDVRLHQPPGRLIKNGLSSGRSGNRLSNGANLNNSLRHDSYYRPRHDPYAEEQACPTRPPRRYSNYDAPRPSREIFHDYSRPDSPPIQGRQYQYREPVLYSR